MRPSAGLRPRVESGRQSVNGHRHRACALAEARMRKPSRRRRRCSWAQAGAGKGRAALRAPERSPREVAQGAVPAGAPAGISGGGTCHRSRPGRPPGAALACAGPTSLPAGTDARGLGGVRSGAPPRPSARGNLPHPGRLSRTHPRLRASTPGRMIGPSDGVSHGVLERPVARLTGANTWRETSVMAWLTVFASRRTRSYRNR